MHNIALAQMLFMAYLILQALLFFKFFMAIVARESLGDWHLSFALSIRSSQGSGVELPGPPKNEK